MTDYITKPIRKNQLLEAVARNLGDDRDRGSVEHVLEGGGDHSDQVAIGFDLSELEQLKQDVGEQLLPTLLQQFLEDTDQRCAGVSVALENADFASVQSAAHALKGSSATMGATRLADCASRLECAAATQDREEIASILPELNEAQSAMLAAISAYQHEEAASRSA